MKNRTLFLVLCISFVCSMPQAGQTCTTFCLDQGDQLVVGKNFDHQSGEGLVIVNKRGVSKTAMANREENGVSQPVSWTSQYGSVTFTHLAREFPFGGVNEAGLVVEIMLLTDTEYPPPDSRPYIDSLQWVQYQLDNFITVEQVIESDSQLRITDRPSDNGTHYLVCDIEGNCASIEFIGGELVYHTGGTMPAKVLANTPYAEDVEYWQQGTPPTPDPIHSAQRFITAANMVTDYDPDTSGPAVDYAFDILTNVDWFVPTQWSIVYDIQNLRIYFRTLENEYIMYVNLSSFDFSCRTPVKVLDVNENLSGEISNNFIDYTYEMNRDLIKKAYPDTSDEGLDFLAHYPESTVCDEIDCFIATAAYGSQMQPHVEMLREFRDRFLLDNTIGKTFVNLYNTYSPPIADFIAKHDNVRAMVRLSLLPIISVSWLALKLGPVLALLFSFLLLALISTTTVFIFLEKCRREVIKTTN